MEPSPSPIAEAFGLGAPTGPLVAITSGPSAMHRSWRLSTNRGRFAVKAFSRDQHAHGVEAPEGPVRLELAALAADVPLPRPCLAVATGAGVAEVAGLDPQPVLVRVHEWVDGSTPTAPASTSLAGELGASWTRHTGEVLELVCRPNLDVHTGVAGWYRQRHGNLRTDGPRAVLAGALKQGGRSFEALWFGPDPLPSVAELAARHGDPSGQGVHFSTDSVRSLWLDRAPSARRTAPLGSP